MSIGFPEMRIARLMAMNEADPDTPLPTLGEMREMAAVHRGWFNVHWYEDNAGPPIMSGIPPFTEEEIFKMDDRKLEDLRRYGCKVPDYDDDLNASHDLETHLSDADHAKFRHELRQMILRENPTLPRFQVSYISSPAPRRLEAYCRAFFPNRFKP